MKYKTQQQKTTQTKTKQKIIHLKYQHIVQRGNPVAITVMVAIHHPGVMSTSMYHRRQQKQPYTAHIRVKVATEIHHTRDRKTKTKTKTNKQNNFYAKILCNKIEFIFCGGGFYPSHSQSFSFIYSSK